MKRTSFLIIVFLLISILAGCAEANAFDWDKTVEAVTGQGLAIDQSFTTEAELTDATRLFNSQHQARGGKFSLEIKRAVVLLKDGDKGTNCQIVEFANSNQAEEYAKYYIATRDKTSAYRIATDGPYIVLTSMSTVVEALDMDFK